MPGSNPPVPCPLLPGTTMDVQPHAQTLTRHYVPMEVGGQQHPWDRSVPCSIPQPQAAVPRRTQRWGAPLMADPTFQSVSTAERKTSEFSWGEKEPLGTETSARHPSLLWCPPPTQLMKSPDTTSTHSLGQHWLQGDTMPTHTRTSTIPAHMCMHYLYVCTHTSVY